MISLIPESARPSGVALGIGLLAVASGALADSAPEFAPEQIEFFETEIRPVLVENCLDCHTGVKAKHGLQLNHRRGWLKGTDYQAVIDLEKPAESLLVHAISHTPGKKVKPMPDEGEKLPPETIAKIVQWIGMGLPWPDDGAGAETDPSRHWSFQPVSPPELPANAGHPIDHFVRKAQEKGGVVPAERADRATLYRRAHFSLLGLPPKYEELEKFVDDPRPDSEAWPELVRHLLASPHYGERWARHWMDVARYSDTKGYEAGGRERRFVHSHTYRDWLIRAFNEDIPYDRFLLYQLAAEQIVDRDGPDKKHLAALGFLSLSKNGRTEIIVDDRIDTTFRGLMALTVGCARCHDHKTDPVSTKEYYGLYSVFANSLAVETPVIGEPKSGPEYEKYLAQLAEKQKVVDDFLEPKLAKIAEENPNIANRRIQLVAKLDRADRRELQNKQRVVDKFVADAGMEPDKAIILTEKEKPSGQRVFIRGNPGRQGEEVQRRFLSIATPGEPKVYEKGGGRLEMARDIAHAANPFTARNLVNRVWMWHFGEGIVRTVDDFGITGEQPDHPELLDFLAAWFVENGWSVKKLHELILTSETWRQGSANPHLQENTLADPENRLLWKFDRKRLELEQMRDAVLDVAGNLSNEIYGRPVKILEPPYSNRRSVYAFIDRQNLNPVFRSFDFSNPQESTGKRPKTTIPMQALFTLNSDFMQNQSALLAEKAKGQEDGVAFLHRAVFAEDPSDADRQLADSFLTAFESEAALLGPRQTNTEWSYGWGQVDAATGAVTFQPYPHWTGDRWQIAAEHPLKDDPRSYLYADEGRTHPGHTAKESSIYRWRAPEDVRVAIRGIVERKAKGQGNGVRVQIVSDKGGIVFDKVLDPTRETLPAAVAEIEVAQNDCLYFVIDPHENNSSFDSVSWSPQVVDLDGAWPNWGLAESFSGPATPATAWSAYAHALLNTNRFLFVE